MIFLRLGAAGGKRRGWVGVVAVAAGVLVVLSGLALLALVVLAAAVVVTCVLLYRRLTGRGIRGFSTRAPATEMEIAPDFEVLPPSSSVAPVFSAARPSELPGPDLRVR